MKLTRRYSVLRSGVLSCLLLALFCVPSHAVGTERTVFRPSDALTAGATYLLASFDAAGAGYLLAAENGILTVQQTSVQEDTQGIYLEAPAENTQWLTEAGGKLKNVGSGLYLRYTNTGVSLSEKTTRWSYDPANYGLSYSGKHLDLGSGGSGPFLTDGVPDIQVWLCAETAAPTENYACADDLAVVDFGLPVNIPVLSNDTLPEGAALTGISSALYGSARIEGNAVCYTPSTHFPGADTLTYTVSSGYTGTLTVFPAAHILYEEDFLTYTGDWELLSEDAASAWQQPDPLGSGTPYGYDPAYECGLTHSLDSARHALVNPNTERSRSASFTFTGTGFTLLSETSRDSGLFLTEVADPATQEVLYRWAVDGFWEGTEPLYQIPIFKSPDLPYGTYQVTFSPVYAQFFDHDDIPGYSLCIDGVYVHTPAQGLDSSCYALDAEGWAQRTELRDELLRTVSDSNSVLSNILFTDRDMSQFDHALTQNNEVYLAPGQSLSFDLTPPAREGLLPEALQLACKALNRTSTLSVTVEEQETVWDVASATPLFRTVRTGQSAVEPFPIVITNTGPAWVSLTELKFTYRKGGPS